MRMNDGVDVGPRFVDGGMNEPLEIERALLVAHRLAVEPELDDIVASRPVRATTERERKKCFGLSGLRMLTWP